MPGERGAQLLADGLAGSDYLQPMAVRALYARGADAQLLSLEPTDEEARKLLDQALQARGLLD